MNARTKKKAQAKDVAARLDALEELTRHMAAEQTAQRERAAVLSDYQTADAKARRVEVQRRARNYRTQIERSRRHRDNRRCLVLLVVALLCLTVALALPVPVPVV